MIQLQRSQICTDWMTILYHHHSIVYGPLLMLLYPRLILNLISPPKEWIKEVKDSVDAKLNDISICVYWTVPRVPILEFKLLSASSFVETCKYEKIYMKIQKRKRLNKFNLLLFNINEPVCLCLMRIWRWWKFSKWDW